MMNEIHSLILVSKEETIDLAWTGNLQISIFYNLLTSILEATRKKTSHAETTKERCYVALTWQLNITLFSICFSFSNPQVIQKM